MNKQKESENDFFQEVEKKSRPPRIGITIGDAAGIGPEITLKALLDKSVREVCLPIVIGDARFLERLADKFDLKINFETIEPDKEFSSDSDKILCYDLANLNQKIIAGEESGTTGKASAENIETAVKLCLEKKIDAIATAPISKKLFQWAVMIFRDIRRCWRI
ncbi:MAG: hypothetical protein HC846_08955 [Blastocatellia bacterium]|nr:hypothetical protein [Blastocatellia bacterium]